MSKERLEQIKDAIAHELGLTDDHMDGTYLYHLTRSKSAFAVGTMTLDDFKEIDEELLDEIFNAIEPFFIKQAERVQELEEESYNAHLERLLDRKEQQNKRYREVIKKAIDDLESECFWDALVALKALEGEE